MDLSGLPQLSGWIRPNEQFDPRSFLLSAVTVGEAAALSILLWPQFVEYRGGVFLEFVFEQDAVDVWFNELKGDVAGVEGVVNHIHLWDAFSAASEQEREVLEELANRVAEMWRASARSTYPSRDLVVFVSHASDDYGPTLTIRSH